MQFLDHIRQQRGPGASKQSRQGRVLLISAAIPFLLLACFSVAAQPAFKIWSLDEPPTNYIDDKGALTGVSVDVARELQKLLHDDTPIEFMPSARATKFSKLEPNVLIFSLARSKVREDAGYQWIIQTTYKPWAFLAKKDSALRIDSLDDAKRLQIGAVHGTAFENYLIENQFPHINASISPSKNILMLLAGRVEAVISNRVIIASQCKLAGNCRTSDFKSLFEPVGYTSWITFSPGSDPQLVKKWKVAADELIRNGTYQSIASKWSQRISTEFGARTHLNKEGVLVFDNQD